MMLIFLDSFWEVAPTPQDFHMLSPWEVNLVHGHEEMDEISFEICAPWVNFSVSYSEAFVSMGFWINIGKNISFLPPMTDWEW